MTRSAAVAEHYQRGLADIDAVLSPIENWIDSLGVAPSVADLGPLDQFHMGGLAATTELARRAEVGSQDRVLDVGSGLGGPARWLAQTFGCVVVGVDLTPAFVQAARRLSAKLGLASLTQFEVADALRLPFVDGSFDLVLSQHVSMNIADRQGLFAELRRVLARGGRLALFDPVLAFPDAEVAYPVPWARTPETSTLLTLEQTGSLIMAAGFEAPSMEDVTDQAMGWMMSQGPARPGAPSLAEIVGPEFPPAVGNYAWNLREGRLRLAMIVARTD